MVCHGPVHVATERHHEVGDAIKPLPPPLIEFRRLAVACRQRIDFLLDAGEAQCEPFLPLPAKLREPMRL